MTEKKTETDWKVVLGSIIVLGALEAYALYLGHNGVILAGVMAIIGFAIGLPIQSPFVKK